MAEENNKMAIKTRWHQLNGDRKQHLDRARHCAKLTIPHLLPEEGKTDHNDPLPTPYQSFGSKAVNHLASKLWLSLLPPNQSFFKLSLSNKVEREIKQVTDGETSRSEIMSSLAAVENAILKYIENKGIRSPAFSAVRQLIATGNALVYIPSSDENMHLWSFHGYGLKVFRLDQYVVVRDSLGNLVELIIKESMSIKALPQEIKEKVEEKIAKDGDHKHTQKEIDLFTKVVRKDDDNKKFVATQEIQGISLEDRKTEFDAGRLPWLALRWSQDSDYGRGPVEEYLGDLQSLESLSQALVEGSLGSAKVIFLVNPNGLTRTKDLQSARNMDFRQGRQDDVAPLHLEKYNDFRVAQTQAVAIESRLSEAFLMNSSMQRDAERVTAQEIQFMAQELEDTLGGVYSILSQEFQLPLVSLVLSRLQDDNEIPKLPQDALNPIVTTGLEALGRNHKQAKLRGFVAEIAQTFGPEMAALYINPSEYIQRAAINQGVDTNGLIRSEQEVQAMIQKQQQSEAATKAAPTVAGKVTESLLEQGGGNG
jgi:hypothetical protein